ncbi:unnamed protein product [Closterium sp. NIES-53]
MLDLLGDYLTASLLAIPLPSSPHSTPLPPLLPHHQFVIMLDLLEDYLTANGHIYERLDGSIKGEQRQDRAEQGREGVPADNEVKTFTSTQNTLSLNPPWCPPLPLVHRIGQSKDVKVYRLITHRTYEQQLFDCASRKYGLEEAILGNYQGASAGNGANGDAAGGGGEGEEADGAGGGGGGRGKRGKGAGGAGGAGGGVAGGGGVRNPEQSKDIESLLQHGAYELFKDEAAEDSVRFTAENIDQILEQRTQTRTIGRSGTSTFSIATFASEEPEGPEETAEEDQDNPEGDRGSPERGGIGSGGDGDENENAGWSGGGGGSRKRSTRSSRGGADGNAIKQGAEFWEELLPEACRAARAAKESPLDGFTPLAREERRRKKVVYAEGGVRKGGGAGGGSGEGAEGGAGEKGKAEERESGESESGEGSSGEEAEGGDRMGRKRGRGTVGGDDGMGEDVAWVGEDGVIEGECGGGRAVRKAKREGQGGAKKLRPWNEAEIKRLEWKVFFSALEGGELKKGDGVRVGAKKEQPWNEAEMKRLEWKVLFSALEGGELKCFYFCTSFLPRPSCCISLPPLPLLPAPLPPPSSLCFPLSSPSPPPSLPHFPRLPDKLRQAAKLQQRSEEEVVEVAAALERVYRSVYSLPESHQLSLDLALRGQKSKPHHRSIDFADPVLSAAVAAYAAANHPGAAAAAAEEDGRKAEELWPREAAGEKLPAAARAAMSTVAFRLRCVKGAER